MLPATGYDTAMEPTIALLANGRAHLKEPGKPLREVQSTFAKESQERQKRNQSIDGWKSRSGVWGNMGMAPPSMAQWDEAEEQQRSWISFRSIARGAKAGQLLYILDLQAVRGLFQFDLAQDLERRLMHRNEFFAHDLACHPVKGTVATSLEQEDGSAHLAFSDDEGRHWNRLSGGDSLDEAPAWVPGEDRRVVFQSAPIGRSKQGHRLGLAPYVIETLDLDGDGKTAVLHQEQDHDLLQPRQSADGTLYFIRRPYQKPGADAPGLGEFALDMLLLPFRFLRAVYMFFNFLSMMFSGQPLATTFGQRQMKPQQAQFLTLWGHAIDTKKAMQKNRGDQAGALVPKDWELVRRTSSGEEQTLANNVLAYDLAADGSVVFTNGTAVFWQKADGSREKICEQTAVESVVCVNTAPG
jgi:hypothetical protein